MCDLASDFRFAARLSSGDPPVGQSTDLLLAGSAKDVWVGASQPIPLAGRGVQQAVSRSQRSVGVMGQSAVPAFCLGPEPEVHQREFLAVKPFLPTTEPKIGTVGGRVGDTARLWAPHQQSYGGVRGDSRCDCAVCSRCGGEVNFPDIRNSRHKARRQSDSDGFDGGDP
jgi:hypothetical protein